MHMQDFGAYQFAAFYLSAGLASSMTAYLARLRRGSGGRSLGASGAVYACFAATALMHPGPNFLRLRRLDQLCITL